MTRRKVKLERIADDAARKVTFRKRSLGLVKKVSELVTLCAVKALLIIYSPNERQPIVWPSIPAAEKMITKYKSFKESERNRKMVTQESYLKERISKTQEYVDKIAKKNKQSEFSYLMHKLKSSGNDLDSLEMEEKEQLIWLLEEKKAEIQKRVEHLRQLPPYMSLGQELPPLVPPFSGGEFMVNGGGSVIWGGGFFAGGSGLSAPPPPVNGGDYLGSLGIGHPQGGPDPFGIGSGQPDPNPFGIGPSEGGTQTDPFGIGSVQPYPNLFGIGPSEGETQIDPFGIGSVQPNPNFLGIGSSEGGTHLDPFGIRSVQPDPDPFGFRSSEWEFEGFSEKIERELAELLNSESDLGEHELPPNISP